MPQCAHWGERGETAARGNTTPFRNSGCGIQNSEFWPVRQKLSGENARSANSPDSFMWEIIVPRGPSGTPAPTMADPGLPSDGILQKAPFRKRELSPQVTEGFPKQRKAPLPTPARSAQPFREGGCHAKRDWGIFSGTGGVRNPPPRRRGPPPFCEREAFCGRPMVGPTGVRAAEGVSPYGAKNTAVPHRGRPSSKHQELKLKLRAEN